MKTEKHYIKYNLAARSIECDSFVEAKKYADMYLKNSKIAHGNDIFILDNNSKPIIVRRWNERGKHGSWEAVGEDVFRW